MKISRGERGQTTVLVAVFLALAFLGLAALAIDVGMLYREKRMVQAAADAAAIAASAQYGTTAITTSAPAAAQQQAGGVLGTEVTPTLISAANSDVQVVITHPTHTFFLGAFLPGMKLVNISALGEASKPPSPSCISSLSPTGIATNVAPLYYCADSSYAGIATSNSGSITSTGCGICANSVVDNCKYSSSTISTDSSVNAASGTYNVTAKSYSAAGNCTDPYSALTKPTVDAGCKDPTWMTGATSAGGANETISPGTYCKFNTANVGTLTMIPGNYVIKTTFSTNGGAKIVANGVMIYLAPGAIADASNYTVSGATPYGIANGTNMTLTAQTSGTYSGIAIWDDSGTASSPDVFTLNGGSNTSITGAIYAPHGIIEDSNGSSAETVNGSITAWAITATGSGKISVTNSGTSSTTGKVTLVR
jgi:hypothetical protein